MSWLYKRRETWYNGRVKSVCPCGAESPRGVTNERIDFTRMNSISPDSPQDKLCIKCNKHPRMGKQYSFPSWCRQCHNEYKRDYGRKTYSTEKGRTKFLLKNYGITQGEYNQMLLRQCGVCACCGEPETALDPRSGKVFALSVDHNHETGRIRSLLCKECNLTVARVENNVRIRNAFAYLQRHDNLDHSVSWPHKKK